MRPEYLPLEKIRVNIHQPRKTFYKETLEELAASIQERGVLQPITVRPLSGNDAGFYEIVMGERRYRASILAGLTHIPAIVRDLTEEEASADALLENFQREDMNAIEKAKAVQGLLSFMPMERVARTLGVSETTVRRLLELLSLPHAIQQELIQRPGAGESAFTEGHARALLPLNDDLLTQTRLVQKIKTERMGVGDVERTVTAIQKYPQKKEAFLKVPVTVADQMVRSLVGQEERKERKKSFKPQTVEQHLKSLDKAGDTLLDFLDERVNDYLSVEQLNQLLAKTAELEKEIADFNEKLRDALTNKDFGFREIYVPCPLCGRVELVGSLRCSVCWTILRRCTDCGNYDGLNEKCLVTGAAVSNNEAENPKDYSRSYKCPMYKPRFPGLQPKLRVL